MPVTWMTQRRRVRLFVRCAVILGADLVKVDSNGSDEVRLVSKLGRGNSGSMFMIVQSASSSLEMSSKVVSARRRVNVF
jgi:hypothetical protein